MTSSHPDWFCNACGHRNQGNWNACQMCRAANPNMPSFASNKPKSNNTKVIGIGFLALILFCGLCGFLGMITDNNKIKNSSLSPVTSTPAVLTGGSKNDSPTLESQSSSISQSFTTNIICSLPRQVASGTPFADLGGGSWGKWGDSNGELDYGCNGGKDSIRLKDDGNVDITAEYGVIGGSQNPHYVSVEYTAYQYTGQTAEEKILRRQYADFCDKLSVKFYGMKLPDKFKKRILDESTYSSSGTANEYAEKVGTGYVNLSSNKNKTLMYMLDVHFFSSELEYKKYKDD
jgi:hypothetical protein